MREKGLGYLGELKRPDGFTSTELSIGVNIDGQEIEIPTLVPTLTEEEKETLLSLPNDPRKIPESIVQKAINHARDRIKAGKNPFAQKGEQVKMENHKGFKYAKPTEIELDEIINSNVDINAVLKDQDWTNKQKQEYFKNYKRHYKKRVDAEFVKQRDAEEDRLTAEAYGFEMKQRAPVVRDVASGVHQGTLAFKSMVERATGLGDADQTNRDIGIIEQGSAEADEGNILTSSLRGAARSVYQASAMSATGPYGIIAGFAASEANSALTEAKDAGLKGKDKWGYVGRAAAIEGGVAGLFQYIGLGGLEKIIGKGSGLTKPGFKAWLKNTAKNTILEELPEETITEILHGFNNSWSKVDPEEMTMNKAVNIFKQTALQTVMAMGMTNTYQGISQQKSLKKREQIAKGLAEKYGWDSEKTIDMVSNAATSKGDFVTSLGREIGNEVMLRPEGLADWAISNPDKAAALMQKEKPSRKDFKEAGLPDRPGKERQGIADDLREIMAAHEETHENMVDVAKQQITAKEDDLTPEIIEAVKKDMTDTAEKKIEVVEEGEEDIEGKLAQAIKEKPKPEPNFKVVGQKPSGANEITVDGTDGAIVTEGSTKHNKYQENLDEGHTFKSDSLIGQPYDPGKDSSEIEVIPSDERDPDITEPTIKKIERPLIKDKDGKVVQKAAAIVALPVEKKKSVPLKRKQMVSELKEKEVLDTVVNNKNRKISTLKTSEIENIYNQVQEGTWKQPEKVVSKTQQAKDLIDNSTFFARHFAEVDTSKVKKNSTFFGKSVKSAESKKQAIMGHARKNAIYELYDVLGIEKKAGQLSAPKGLEDNLDKIKEFVDTTDKIAHEDEQEINPSDLQPGEFVFTNGEWMEVKPSKKEDIVTLQDGVKIDIPEEKLLKVAGGKAVNIKGGEVRQVSEGEDSFEFGSESEQEKKKEPWEMTWDEYYKNADSNEWSKYSEKKYGKLVYGIGHEYHENIVRQAISEGKPVPDKVLKDYPELQETQTPKMSAENPLLTEEEDKNDFQLVGDVKGDSDQKLKKRLAEDENKQFQKENQKDLFEKQQVPSGNAMAALGGDSFLDTSKKTKETVKKGRKENPTAQKGGTRDFVDGIISIAAPGVLSKPGSAIIRESTAKAAQRDEVIRHTLDKYSKLFHSMPEKDIVDFIDKMETGKPQSTPELQEVSLALREILDKTREYVQAHGKLKEYYENYFPHLYKDPKKSRDVIRGILGNRQLKPASFLKERKYLTIKEGLDKGLELAHYNPIEMVIARCYEMNKYVAGADAFQRMKQEGFATFVPESLDKSYLPSGYEFIEDPAFKVVATPEVTVKEAYDKLLVDQLLGVAKRLGVSHTRLNKMKGSRWGESGPGAHISTRFAGPASVIAHEIGHQIGDMADLYNHLITGAHLEGRVYKSGTKKGQPVKVDIQQNRSVIKKEMRALADLRLENQETSDNFKKYVRKKQEKEAVILEAWLASPEKMAKVAPTVTAAWKEFLQENEVLRPLLNLDRSVVLGSSSTKYELKGVLTLGRWAVPSEVATIINNHLSPGIRSSKNEAVSGTYNLLRFLGNAMNQASLSLSGFHALNVSFDAMLSHFGLASQKIFRGDLVGAAKLVAETPVASITSLKKGDELIKAMRTDLDKLDPKTRMMVETIIKAGGRASMDTMYHNHAVKGIVQTIRDIRFGDSTSKALGGAKLIPQSIFAALELTAKPIMEWQVPRLKLGVFYMFASDIMAQAEKKGWTEEKTTQELMDAWDSVDNRMGQLAYDNLHWNKLIKDSLMLAFRSVGWNLGSIREFGGALAHTANPVGYVKRYKAGDDLVTRKMGYAFASILIYAASAGTLMKLLSGDWPWEDDEAEGLWEYAKNFFFPKTGRTNPNGSPERLSLPHYSKDWVAWATRPAKTLQHKLHPIWGTISDIIENEDYYGTEIRDPDDPYAKQAADAILHIGQSFLPFSVRNYSKMRDAGESKPLAALMAGSGISSAPGYISKTRAHQLMSTILADRIPDKSRTKEDVEKSTRRKETIQALRSKKKMDLSGWTSREKEFILKEAKLTQFQSTFKRLSVKDAVNVFNICNTRERIAAWSILLKKMSQRDIPQDVQEMFYELKLNQAQIDDQVKAGIQKCRNLAYGIADPEASDLRKEELLEQLKQNPQYEDDWKFVLAAFRHRWLFNIEGKKTGRRVGTKAYWKRVRQLVKVVKGIN